MGIRIHKCLGYGLTDLKKNDPRLNELGYFMSDDEYRDEIWTAEGWANYYKNHSRLPIYYHEIKEDALWDPYESIIYDDEGMSNVLLIVPNACKDWMRYDDIIDYIECNPQTDSFKVLNAGIWPYIVTYTDLRTLQKCDRIAHEFWYAVRSAEDEHGKRKKMFINDARTYAKEMGFRDIGQAKKNILPEVPEVIQLFCKWTCLFNDESTIHQLRPMIYTFWR